MVALSLKVRKLSEEPGINETQDGYENVNTIWAVLKRTDISAFSSRIFRIEQGGHTSTHKHNREHVAIVISGNCSAESNNEEKIVSQGSIITVPQHLPHRFKNPGPGRLVLLIMNIFTELDEKEQD